MKRQLGRVLLWGLVLAGLLAAFFLDRYSSEQLSLHRAHAFLISGRAHDAAAIYQTLVQSLWYGSQASAGLAVSRVLEGVAGGPDMQPRETTALKGFPNQFLLQRSLREREFEKCLRLADLLLDAGVDSTAPLYKAAALLELGETEGSAQMLVSLPENLKGRRLVRNLRFAHARLRHSAQVLVYDRNGEEVGFVDHDGGLVLESSLRELVPIRALQVDRLDRAWRGVRLSIDLELSRLALDALHGYRGSVVLLEPGSGEILAAVSDSGTRQTHPDAALQQLAEPASVAKIITASAAFRSGMDVNRTIAEMTCEGARKYRGGLLYCSYQAGPLQNLNRALSISCNIAFANLGVRVGRQQLIRELRRFGFDRQAPEGMRLGRILIPAGNQRQLADLSIGLEATAMTPLHGALIASVFANGGVMPQPSLLHAEEGILGVSPIRLPSPDGWDELNNAAWIPDLLEAMEEVTQAGGTGSGILPEAVRFAMKTGTARNSRLSYYTNYVGLVPLPEPELAFCVRVTQQRTSSRVRRATYRVTSKLLRMLADKQHWKWEPRAQVGAQPGTSERISP